MKGNVTNTGYWPDSPDRNNDFNIIPSNNITMEGMDIPLMGVSNKGDKKLMVPGKNYKFKGDSVMETPVDKGIFLGAYKQVGGQLVPHNTDNKQLSKAQNGKEQIKLNIPQQFRTAPNLVDQVHINIPKTSGLGDFTTHREPKEEYPTVQLPKKEEPRIFQHPDEPIDKVIEFIDKTGVMSYDDARNAYNNWQSSGTTFPTLEQGLSMFSAIPGLGSYGKLKYVDPLSIKNVKTFDWQKALNLWDTWCEDNPELCDEKANGEDVSIPNLSRQDGGDMPLGLPLKEQNIYTLPEYNQPRNPKTGEILPDPQRPNLGMDTGATEYKYTYGMDEGDVDVPSIVAGQYIGDQALDRYMLTGDRFKTMADPSSYSKFYDTIGQLGLMQEKQGGSVKKVKIKSLPKNWKSQ